MDEPVGRWQAVAAHNQKGVVKMSMRKFAVVLMTFCVAYILSQSTVGAQTSTFTYQGKISDSGTPATGNYDFQFKLFDALASGTQQGATVTLMSVTVADGIFTVQLDFGAAIFSGTARFLEIGVRSAGGGAFTILNPRQQITSTPYAIKSLNAASADG